MTKTMLWNSETETYIPLERSDRDTAVREIVERLQESATTSEEVPRQRELSRLRWATAGTRNA
jgi:hypothetical protein